MAKNRLHSMKKTATKTAAKDYRLPKGKVLVLRTCKKDLTSYNGFKWPASGFVKCPDWNPEPICGYGLHGLLWGEGRATLLDLDDTDAKWLVVEVSKTTIVDLNGKVKFPSGKVVFVGDKDTAPQWLMTHGGEGKASVNGKSTSGYNGKSTSGNYGQSTSGNYGKSTSGDNGQSTSGDNGQSTSGYDGRAKTGDIGIIVITWHDNSKNRCRLTVGYVGEDGIEANTFYKCDTDGKLIKA
jgi:hypothetical protein